MAYSPTVRKTDLVVQRSRRELLLYDLKSNKAFCMNDTSATIWGLCDGKRNFKSIAKKASNTFGNKCSEEAVRFTVHEIRDQDLISNPANRNTQLDKFSRRELIRKIGFGTADHILNRRTRRGKCYELR